MIQELVDQIEGRFVELERQMADPELHSDRERAAEVGREYRELQSAHELAREWLTLKDDLEGARELLAEDGDDPELKSVMAEAPARLEELAEEIISDGDKALIFTQYSEFGSMLQPYLAAHLDRPVLWLHGGLSKAKRDALVERFQTDDEPMLFLLSLKAAGTGLNLTAANHVIHYDRWWNPAVENQATDRAFRIGQKRNVQVRKFICTGTLEEKIDAMIERKKALAESVVGTGEDWVTDLSTDQLRELFALDRAAVR